MADEWFDIDKIKVALKKAANGPVAFGFGVGGKPEDGKMAMSPKRSPEFLGKALKKEGFKPNRILIGNATTEGPKLIVTCEAEVPKSIKAIRYFLKENQLIQKKVQLIGPNGEFDADDAEDGEDAGGAATGPAATGPAATGPTGPEPAAAAGPGEEQIEFQRRFAALTPRVKTLLTELGANAPAFGAKFKQAHTLGQKGDYAGALTLLDELDALIEGNAKASPQAEANPLAAEWSKQLGKLVPQIKEVLSSQLAGSRDIALKFKEAQAFGSKQEYEAGIAMLDEISAMIQALTSGNDELKAEWTQRVKALAPQIKDILTAKLDGSREIALKFKEAQGFESKQDFESGIAMLDEISAMIKDLSSGQNKDSADWTQRFSALEPDLARVLELGLGDPSKLRAARDMAIEKAESGDYASALKILDRLQPAVAQALASATPPAEEQKTGDEAVKGKIAPSVAFTHSRLAWNGAREKIQADLTSLEKAILDAAKDEAPEIFADIKGKTSKLYAILGTHNANLMDKLDEGYTAEKDSPAQFKAYQEAGKLVKDYIKFVNGSPLVQEIDSNPFKPVAVKKTLDTTLQELAGKLAA